MFSKSGFEERCQKLERKIKEATPAVAKTASDGKSEATAAHMKEASAEATEGKSVAAAAKKKMQHRQQRQQMKDRRKKINE